VRCQCRSGQIRKSQEQSQDGYCRPSKRREIFTFQPSVRGVLPILLNLRTSEKSGTDPKLTCADVGGRREFPFLHNRGTPIDWHTFLILKAVADKSHMKCAPDSFTAWDSGTSRTSLAAQFRTSGMSPPPPTAVCPVLDHGLAIILQTVKGTSAPRPPSDSLRCVERGDAKKQAHLTAVTACLSTCASSLTESAVELSPHTHAPVAATRARRR
jgi:hypothetical protein